MTRLHSAPVLGASLSRPLLLGLAGPAGCGKTTAATLMCGRAGWVRLSFADPLRSLLLALHPSWDLWHLGPGKDLTPSDGGLSPREMMRACGDWAKALHPTFFIDIAHQAIQDHRRLGRHVIIDDVRFEGEADLLRGLGGHVVHVSRTDVKFRRDHNSELGIEPAPGDLHLRNWGGIAALHDELQHVLHSALLRARGHAADNDDDPATDHVAQEDAPPALGRQPAPRRVMA